MPSRQGLKNSMFFRGFRARISRDVVERKIGRQMLAPNISSK